MPKKYIELDKELPFINDSKDIINLFERCHQAGVNRILIRENQMNPKFSDLSTGFAGEVIQKFQTYRVELVFVIQNKDGKSSYFWQLTNDRNLLTRFFTSEEEAVKWLER
jgi:Domain of unknown function (DUF4180)